jgi:hypothetical protein
MELDYENRINEFFAVVKDKEGKIGLRRLHSLECEFVSVGVDSDCVALGEFAG